jgi:hypothetical protein
MIPKRQGGVKPGLDPAFIYAFEKTGLLKLRPTGASMRSMPANW